MAELIHLGTRRRSISEKLIIYSIFEKSLSNGHVMADKDRKEHCGVHHLPTLSLLNKLSHLIN